MQTKMAEGHHVRHQRVAALKLTENCDIDSDLSDYEEVEKPSSFGAHLSDRVDIRIIPEENEDEVEDGEDDQVVEDLRYESYSNLKEQLQSFYDNKVVDSLSRKSTCEDIAYSVTHKIMRKVQTVDSRFRANSLVSLGIPYDGLQASQPIFFDMMLQLSLGSNNTMCLVRDKNPHFVKFQPIERGPWLDCMGKNSLCVSPKYVLRILRHYVKRAVHVLRKYINSDKRGKLPDKLQSLEMDDRCYDVSLIINRNIHVRIMPSISIPDCRSDLSRTDCPSTSHVVAVKMPSTGELIEKNNIDDKSLDKSDKNDCIHDENNNKVVWKFSFFVAEKNKMRTVSDGCRIKLLRILTEIRDNDPRLMSLSAYHLKTIFFHEIDHQRRRGDWSDSKISKRYLGILRRISDFLRQGVCPCYFMQPPDFPLLNLFEDIDKENLRMMREVVDDIIDSPSMVLK